MAAEMQAELEGGYQQLEAYLGRLPVGPGGGAGRVMLARGRVTSDGKMESKELRKLGTYGFIRGTPGFMFGAVAGNEQEMGLEDYGYRMECAVLMATSLGLGTCWLGGSFTRSSFSRLMRLQAGEVLPAVIAVGKAAAQPSLMEATIRAQAQSDNRLRWETLFFDGSFERCLDGAAAGKYETPLEMVRLAPSASNKQPWRVVRAGGGWHFYRQRTPGYRESWLTRLLKVADMQRVDLGIAMAHFELAAREAGLKGTWVRKEPGISVPDGMTGYVASWIE
jgi:hypothetical protein